MGETDIQISNITYTSSGPSSTSFLKISKHCKSSVNLIIPPKKYGVDNTKLPITTISNIEICGLN